MGIIKRFIHSNSLKDPHALRSEVMTLLEKGAIERVRPAQSVSGFYSRYFLVPKKDGGLRPILDLNHLNHALMRRSFRMIMLKQILLQIRTRDWLFSMDLKDAYFHTQIAPHHRRFLRFAFEGVAYQYTYLPLDCLWPLELLKSAWMRLFPLKDKWESAFSTTSTPGSFWPSQRWSYIAQNPSPQPPRAPGAQG